MNRLAVAAAVLACLAAFTSTASAAKFTNRMVTVKIEGSQKTTWKAAPVADEGCQNKLTGQQGSGTETIEWSQSRSLKGQLTGSGKYWGLMLFDKRNQPTSNMPISGSVNRSGGGVTVVCGKTMDDESAPCLGRKTFDTNAWLTFGANRQFTVSDNELVMTTSLYPNCNWVYNGMTVRVGAVLLNIGAGKFDPKRLSGRSSYSLRSHDTQRCQDEGAEPGIECTTVTDWRVTLYPTGKKRRR